MVAFILGQKDRQTQTYNANGIRIPVTYIKTAPCYLIAIQKPEKQSYFAGIRFEAGFQKNGHTRGAA